MPITVPDVVVSTIEVPILYNAGESRAERETPDSLVDPELEGKLKDITHVRRFVKR